MKNVQEPSGTGPITPGLPSESAGTVLSSLSASGVEKTATRISKRGRRNEGRPPITQHLKTNVAVMLAEGMTQRAVAKTLGVSHATVHELKKRPDVQAQVTELRAIWKEIAHQAIQKTAPEAWQMLHESAQARDYKGFDYGARGLHALEKISHSVSGEGTKVEVTGVEGGPLQVDVRALLVKIAEHYARPP